MKTIDINCNRAIYIPGKGVVTPISGHAPVEIATLYQWLGYAMQYEAAINRAIANMHDLIREAEAQP